MLPLLALLGQAAAAIGSVAGTVGSAIGTAGSAVGSAVGSVGGGIGKLVGGGLDMTKTLSAGKDINLFGQSKLGQVGNQMVSSGLRGNNNQPQQNVDPLELIRRMRGNKAEQIQQKTLADLKTFM